MYIFKNAMRCIARSKGRSILIGAVVLLLSVSSCVGLSIKQANKTLKKQYADNMEITASINQKDARNGNSMDLETLQSLADNKLVKSFNYTKSVYFAANEGIEPVDVSGDFKQNKDFREEFGDIKSGDQTTSTIESSETTTTESSSETTENGGTPTPPSGDMPSGEGGQGGNTFITNNFFFNMANMNDFTITSYSDLSAMPEYISSLNVIDNDSEELNCVISENLAEENEIEVGATFTLKNPDNEDEVYTFTVVGLCDTSESTESTDTASNASFADNNIYVSAAALDAITTASASLNTETDDQGNTDALSPSYTGTFIFANLKNYNKFSKSLDETYTLVSTDVSNYEQSVSQLETLSKYATYFLIVIFIIGAFVLVIINLFSIRNRKYEIGVLTAIGMKKWKVASQFVIELFVITFAALVIGSGVGAATSVPITNNLLTTINSSSETETNSQNEALTPPNENNAEKSSTETASQDGASQADGQNTPPSKPDGNGFGGMMSNFTPKVNNYIASVNSATDITVILQMILVGLGLTLISSLAAVAFVMRYEPLKILSNRD